MPYQQGQFRRWTFVLPRAAWQGARFVGAGCGIGRNSFGRWPTARLWLALRLGRRRIESLRLLHGLSFAQLRAMVFDQMIPRMAHDWPREAVERLMREAGLADVRLAWVNEMSWSAVGRTPS